jgi:hypothetical protein
MGPIYTIVVIDDEEKHVFATMFYLNARGFRSFGASS